MHSMGYGESDPYGYGGSSIPDLHKFHKVKAESNSI